MNMDQLKEQFANPDACYRPMLFWLWNGEITPAGIDAALRDFVSKGIGGVFIHPMGENFRLGDFVQGISPPYLSPEYFALIRTAVEKARELGLTVWLYDEGGWPSGTAQGKVVEGHDELRGHRLHARRTSPLEISQLSPNTVAAVGLPEMGVPVPLNLKDFGSRLIPYSEIIVFTLESDGFPVDVLNPVAVRRFIEVTHEQYAEAVGEHFGSTVVGMFTDETSLGGRAGDRAIPWTRQLLECLNGQMGRDARTYLPLLFDPEVIGPEVVARYSEHEQVAARCEYYDCLSRRFQQAYWQQLTDWCQAHNLLHTGHVAGEDNLPDHIHFAHFFRTVGVLSAPGVDAIWRQLFPEQENFPFPRFASSVLARRPRDTAGPWQNLVLTESNAVYGYGMHYGEMRWVADYQFQCGINMYCPMACYYTTTEGRIYGTMSHFGPGQPLWRYYRMFSDYIGRFSALLRLSAQHPKVAVYYPIETLWASAEAGQLTWESLRQVGLALVENQQAFNFIDGDLLAEMEVSSGCLQHQAESYETVIVPASLTMPLAALERLDEFAAAGGRLLWVDYFPAQASEMASGQQFSDLLLRLIDDLPGGRPLPLGELPGQLRRSGQPDSEVQLTDELPRLNYNCRQLGDGQLHLLTNDSPLPVEPLLRVGGPQALQLEVWDLRDGEILTMLKVAAGDKVDFKPLLAPWTTEVLVTRPAESPSPTPRQTDLDPRARNFLCWLATPAADRGGVPPQIDILAEYTEADAIQITEEYRLEGGTVVSAVPDGSSHPFAQGAAPLLCWDEWGLDGFSGRVEYTFELTVAAEYLSQPLLLDLGEVYWAATVQINGQLVGETLWAPHTFDLSGYLTGTKNTMVIGVSNTLASQVCRESVQLEATERGWCNTYLQRALPMMQDHRSGLVGPVRIMIGRVR